MALFFNPACLFRSARLLGTSEYHSTFFDDFLVSVGSFFGYNPCLFGMLVILGLHFGRNDDPINSF